MQEIFSLDESIIHQLNNLLDHLELGSEPVDKLQEQLHHFKQAIESFRNQLNTDPDNQQASFTYDILDSDIQSSLCGHIACQIVSSEFGSSFSPLLEQKRQSSNYISQLSLKDYFQEFHKSTTPFVNSFLISQEEQLYVIDQLKQNKTRNIYNIFNIIESSCPATYQAFQREYAKSCVFNETTLGYLLFNAGNFANYAEAVDELFPTFHNSIAKLTYFQQYSNAFLLQFFDCTAARGERCSHVAPLDYEGEYPSCPICKSSVFVIYQVLLNQNSKSRFDI